MQIADEQKRENILSAAAELFAAQPFHKVLLSDVAEKAAVGKGTIYVYFRSKEQLYLAVLLTGFSQLVTRLRENSENSVARPMDHIEMVIREIVDFACNNPHMFEVMKTLPGWESPLREGWQQKRRELKDLIQSFIRNGIEEGEFHDPHPELTARYIPGLVRSALMDGIHTDPAVLCDHIIRFVKRALTMVKDKDRIS